MAGYEDALAGAGRSASRQVYWGEYTQETGERCAREAVRSAQSPTAIFAANNFLAIGVMRGLRDEGIRVPEDISVVAFDDLPAGLTIEPFFTVAAQPAYELGQQATELLLQRLAGTGPDEPQEIILPIEVIVRASSAPLDVIGQGRRQRNVPWQPAHPPQDAPPALVDHLRHLPPALFKHVPAGV